MARGNHARAIELMLQADRESRSGFTLESLAWAHEQSQNTDQAITYSEEFLAYRDRPLGFELQQPWIAAHYRLALVYFARGDKARAQDLLNRLLSLWKAANPDLPLRKDASRLLQKTES